MIIIIGYYYDLEKPSSPTVLFIRCFIFIFCRYYLFNFYLVYQRMSNKHYRHLTWEKDWGVQSCYLFFVSIAAGLSFIVLQFVFVQCLLLLLSMVL
jgi:hypothetical protein